MLHGVHPYLVPRGAPYPYPCLSPLRRWWPPHHHPPPNIGGHRALCRTGHRAGISHGENGPGMMAPSSPLPKSLQVLLAGRSSTASHQSPVTSHHARTALLGSLASPSRQSFGRWCRDAGGRRARRGTLASRGHCTGPVITAFLISLVLLRCIQPRTIYMWHTPAQLNFISTNKDPPAQAQWL